MEFVPRSGEIIGYIASGPVFPTFCMKTMMPLRLTTIASKGALTTPPSHLLADAAV